jgi:myo-inositol-1(or 4)-monophosphatase
VTTLPDIDRQWKALADVAQDLARQAGALVTEMAASARRDPDTKSSTTDLVTAADRAAENHIVDGLLACRPDDAIEGEEGASRPGTSGVTWHIDPIDGTTNYVYDIPAFSVSIAAAVDDRMVAGVVYDPVNDVLYRAVSGQGASCNGEPVRCSANDELATALVATGFGYDRHRRRHQAELLVEILPRVRDIRRFGSAALDLCAVASGRVDAYFERGLNMWDLAAGWLIASEAGAVVGNLHGGPPDTRFLVAAPAALFDPLVGLLADLEADRGP